VFIFGTIGATEYDTNMTPCPGTFIVWFDDEHVGARKGTVLSAVKYFDGEFTGYEVFMIEDKSVTSWFIWERERGTTWRSF
jgi:hypothetical protein